MSPNMTEKHLKNIFKALPKEMDEGEISALTLTIHDAYLDEPAELINNLIATIYSYGMSVGISHLSISEGLRRTADIQDEDYQPRMRN
jgi:transcriptional antiterminator